MGDISTHVIFRSGYWYLVYEDNGAWISSSDDTYLCQVGTEEKKFELERIQ